MALHLVMRCILTRYSFGTLFVTMPVDENSMIYEKVRGNGEKTAW